MAEIKTSEVKEEEGGHFSLSFEFNHKVQKCRIQLVIKQVNISPEHSS